MSTVAIPPLAWTRDFIVIDGSIPAALALQQIEATTARWVVISRADGAYLYAFTLDELWDWPALRASRERGGDWLELPFAEVLSLHEEHSSTATETRSDLPPIDRSWRLGAEAPSIDRYVEIGTDRTPRAIGAEGMRSRRVRSARPVLLAEPPPDVPDPPAAEDEGTTPVRYPSIESDSTPAPGVELTLTIDLLRAAVSHTQGGPVAVGPLAADWESLDLSVVLSCPRIDFEGEGRGTVTIRRNADSLPARIKGRMQEDAPAGEMAVVSAAFFHATRFCGSAFRMFTIDGGAAATPPPTRGTVVAEPAAQSPDLTVRISTASGAPGKLDWLVQTARFAGLPPKLREQIDLGQDPGAEAGVLFGEFATLERGQHRARIEGFGDRLWQRAPQMFRSVYWAVWDHYRRPLTIQFISDEPHLAWELMRPTRADDSEIHPPLALKHAVARWIERWDGYMRNQLPDGRILTIAPKYPTVSRRLVRAQSESKALIDQFGATRVDGTRAGVTALLEDAPSPSVAVLHFAGHGQFARTATTESTIKLEDGALAASEVARPEVKLGKACRTLVFFNACEIGATGSVFGEVGGWADAFLGRQFGGFIAPLWSVDDEDASVVAAELLEGIVKRHEPIGEALRAIRAKHGDVSPTFYSYLYYGDVTARLQP